MVEIISNGALAVFLVVMAAGAVYFIRQFIMYAKGWRPFWRQDFERVFGFEPPSADVGLEKLVELQRKVDEALADRAAAFARADLRERKARAAVKKAPNRSEKEARMKRVATAQRYVEGSKEIFWAVHGLAKSAGFAVQGSYKDYLLDEELRAEV